MDLYEELKSRGLVYQVSSRRAKREGVGGGRNFCPLVLAVPVPFEQEKSGRGVGGEFRFSLAKSK